MLLLLRKKRGENGACAEPTSGQGHFWTWPLPDSGSSGHVTLTSGQKAPLGRIWRNFRLRMRRTYFRTVHMTDVTYVHMTSGCSSSLLRKCGFVLADILLTIHVFLSKHNESIIRNRHKSLSDFYSISFQLLFLFLIWMCFIDMEI